MPLTAKERRLLMAASHRLKPVATVAADALTDVAVEHVRTALRTHELIKVRVPAEKGADCDAAAHDLAKRTMSEVVKRVGRIVLLYRRPAGPEAAVSKDKPPTD